MELKKTTIAVSLENVEKLEFLMSKIKFIENSRVATGGMMSTPCLLIEFQGAKETYHENGYIVEKAESQWGNDTYFTIKNPEGLRFKTLEDFKEHLKNEKVDFEYNELTN